MLSEIFFASITIVGLWGIGLVTITKNSQNRIHQTFSALAVSLGLWIFFLTIADIVSDNSLSLWSLRLALFFGTLMAPSLLYFSRYFPVNLRPIRRRFHYIVLVPALTFMILSLTPWLVPAVTNESGTATPTNVGILYTIQTVYVVGAFIGAFVILLRKLRHVSPKERQQIVFVLGGLGIALAVNVITGFFLLITHRSSRISSIVGELSLLFIVGTTAYAIVKHKLFEIRLAIARTIGFIATISIVAGIYSLIIIGLGAPFITGGDVTLIKNNTQLLWLIPPTIFVGLTFHSIQQFIAKLTRRIFYQDEYDLRSTLDVLSDTLVANTNIDDIMQKSLDVIKGAIKPSRFYFLVFNDAGRVHKKIAQHASSPPSISELVGDLKNVATNPVAKDNLTPEAVPPSLVANDISLVLRLGPRDKPRGLVLFGPKNNGRVYTEKDIDLLRIGAKNLDVALENAKKYEQISHFADTMHQEVLRATTKLRKANKELKTLDALKDDFISMASHQLRTPATSVHEAIQMLNNPPGSLTKTEKDRLTELAEASSEHLVSVVADMLSIARIQAGHLIPNKSPAVMQEVVERVLKQTSILADQKHIKLVFNKPAAPIQAELDLPKINEAMTNYIENAIKYSPEQTTVTITLLEDNKQVHFEVADQGMGVPKNEQKNLFEKFYRAQNAREEQPDGNGIGLFVVKSIAMAHGGDAYYEPQTTGSVFGLWLPIA
ncbi:MAG TPA: ATP-binding protein [Candidatus Saccharimonadales bacterium]|nr:ATP-binding protein [Candidatus Saccharimonadales bacterium]